MLRCLGSWRNLSLYRNRLTSNLVSVLDLRYLDVLGSSGWPFLRWLCVGDTCLDSYPPCHPCDAKGSNRLQIQGRNSHLYHSRQKKLRLAQESQVLEQLCIVRRRSHRSSLRILSWCHLQKLTLCSPLLAFDFFGYPCLCQYFCRRNCHTPLHQDSSVIEIAMHLSPHLKLVTRRSSKKHHAKRPMSVSSNGEIADSALV